MPGYASHILERYLHEIGMERPADAAQQYQVELLRQWLGHLQVVLRDNDVPVEVTQNILREFLYGAVPQHAEARMREELASEVRLMHEGQQIGMAKIRADDQGIAFTAVADPSLPYSPVHGLLHRHREDGKAWREHAHLGGAEHHTHDPETDLQIPGDYHA